MILPTKLKERVEVSSQEIIQYLKDENLYVADNKISNICTNIAPLDNTNSTSISWINRSNYEIDSLNSSILIVGKDFKAQSESKTIIYTLDPKLAITLIINRFFMERVESGYISNRAVIDDSVKIGKNCIINENVVIGKNCQIGDNVVIYPNVTIYPNTVIGNNVIINAGTSIGQEGFGHVKSLEGEFIQFPHIGRVIIEDDVDIGANVTIDRGALKDTIIKEGVKINNLVHIAHNVKIGKGCTICSKVSISGSVNIEDNVYIAPNATIIDGVTIKEGATIGIGAIIRKDIEKNSVIVAFDGFERREYIKAKKILKG